ncbi:MAG: hypothetical protein HYX86_05815 [Chloroflexi bacterium]|nr:hypothetical protein [Chloroflexota bacterium]
MPTNNRRTGYFWVLVILGLLFAGCATVTVTNTSKEYSARVSLVMPDGDGGQVRLVKSGQSIYGASVSGGTFTVTVLPNEQYLAWLNDTSLKIATALGGSALGEVLTGQGLSPGQVAALQLALELIRSEIKDIETTGTSYTGTLTENSEADCTLVWEDPLTAWDIYCSITVNPPSEFEF